MPTLPTNPHYIGDSGHVNDHNTIVTALASAAYLSGGNIVDKTGSTTYRFGKMLQVVAASTSTAANTTSSTFGSTNLSCSITPVSTSSRVIVLAFHHTYVVHSTNADGWGAIRLKRGSTVIWTPTQLYAVGLKGGSASGNEIRLFTPLFYLDSPSTTGATTYATESAAYNGARFELNTLAPAQMILIEVGP